MAVALMFYTLRSTSLTHYVEVARAAGLDPYQQLRAARIPSAALLEPDLRIRADLVGHLIELSAKASEIDDFGLRMAAFGDFSSLGPLRLVMRESPTMRKALASMVRYMDLQNEALLMWLEPAGSLVVIHLQVLGEWPGAMRQATDLAVGVTFRTIRQALGERWRPRSISFTHGAPASTATSLQLFGMPADYNQDFDGIVCAAADLDVALPSYDPLMAREVKHYLDTLLTQSASTMQGRVRKLVYMLMSTGECSVDRVAQHLGVDRRTIHRRLAQEQCTYSALLDAARVDLVFRYIENAARPLSDVATLLGFSSLSAFSRWFNSRFGCNITSWRRGGSSSPR